MIQAQGIRGSRIAVAIPTYNRGGDLLRTVHDLLGLKTPPEELLVVDQTDCHTAEIAEELSALHASGTIQWIRLAFPSITHAMNTALLQARSELVLFTDDDVRVKEGLLDFHVQNYAQDEIWAVVGKVLGDISPNTKDRDLNRKIKAHSFDLTTDLDFDFSSNRRRPVFNCKALNLSVRRQRAIEVGGFDENFLGTAFRFETEFCRRLCLHGGTVMYDPLPEVFHLHVSAGGTREFGKSVHSADWRHFHGDYYFAFKCGQGLEIPLYLMKRIRSTTFNSYGIKRPGLLAKKLLAHAKAFSNARKLAKQLPKLISKKGSQSEVVG